MSQDELNEADIPDPEVMPQAKRRRFSAEYKLRILEEVDVCTEPGQDRSPAASGRAVLVAPDHLASLVPNSWT